MVGAEEEAWCMNEARRLFPRVNFGELVNVRIEYDTIIRFCWFRNKEVLPRKFVVTFGFEGGRKVRLLRNGAMGCISELLRVGHRLQRHC